jgi:hypothetical protein
VARHQEILKYGPPTTGIPAILTYENHVLEYDTARRVPKVGNYVIFSFKLDPDSEKKFGRFRDAIISDLQR